MAPLYKYGWFGDEASLIAAFVIGIGFGFFLERAGFGSARKLTAQFYLRDMAVFKVMFTAIVTAMLGLFYLGWAGWLDVSMVYVNPTYLLPQMVGGLVLGLGFIIGGYCPGTALVGGATLRLDAVAFIGGVLGGILLFGEAYPWIAGFADQTAMGSITLPEMLGLSVGQVVFLVVMMAVAGFAGATAVERLMARRVTEAQP
jgi:hypothetical protein